MIRPLLHFNLKHFSIVLSLILFICSCLFIACNNNPLPLPKPPPEVPPPAITLGSVHGGGLICYLDSTGKHGLIAAPKNQSSGIQWFNGSDLITKASGSSLGTGGSNSDYINAVQGQGNYAARICTDLELDGYRDWFLPSKEELNKMYLNLKLKEIGFFVDGFYWSSSEANGMSAWAQDFSSGAQGRGNKSALGYVRAMRAF